MSPTCGDDGALIPMILFDEGQAGLVEADWVRLVVGGSAFIEAQRGDQKGAWARETAGRISLGWVWSNGLTLAQLSGLALEMG